ncbi:MAG: BrnA antitoxin family protein [Bauldia sp.]
MRKVDAHVITPEEYDEAPVLTAEQIARADVYEGERLIRRGRPPKARPKQAIKLRLSPEVLEHFRATGRGWQTRIDEVLKRAAKRGKRTAARR